MLLNSNNQTRFTRDADVVVAGARITGLCYTIDLKNISPHLKIEVFEKSQAPMQKIGESTLSSFTRFMNGEMLYQDYVIRLFGLNDGPQFYCIDGKGMSVTCEDVGRLNILFQLNRRMSELFFTMWAQSLRANLYHGVDIVFELPKEELSVKQHGWNIPNFEWSNTKPTGSFSTPQAMLKDS
jgi:hypothetical protein